MAFVLSLAMVAGLVPAMSGGANTVQAASGSGTEPSVSAYATKTQLMDGTFAPNANGTAANIGKLVFGKNSSGTAQQWYILGKDEDVSGDNTIIFAASPIATRQAFNSSIDNKTDSNLWSDCTYGGGTVNEVFANHYGASNLRKELKTMATDTSYFTSAEQGWMNDTTVTTRDTKNSATYTTTDKLYALQGKYNDDNKLWAGSSDSTVLAKSSYWSSGDVFWLRSPVGGNSSSTLLVLPGDGVGGGDVSLELTVQPASNLNLSSVLFASSATAASSDTVSNTIASETAMTLRFDGTGKNIGTVTYNTTPGDIKVAKGSTSQTVALVVQGNGGRNDWYYSKQITGTEIVKVSDIVAASNTPSSIDLSTCKIWLEITDSTENLTYAVNASQTPDVTAPSITTQPGNATVKVGETATFTLAASGTALTYQWQIDRNDGNGWVNIAGANEASYTTSTVNISCSGFKYQCVVSNSAGTVTSNTAVLTVTENNIPDPDPVDYEILDGANSNWEQNSDGSLSIRGSGALYKFVGVKVDGTLVDAKNYTVKEGSTIVTLKADYLNTLSVGTHTFEILWTDGSASTTFTSKADSSDNGNNNQNDNDNSNRDDSVLPDDSDQKEEAPKTGDDTPSVWLFILTIISGTGLILTAKKRRKNLKMSEK